MRRDLEPLVAHVRSLGFDGFAFALLDVAARGLVPASLLLASSGSFDVAFHLALATQGLVLVRSLWSGARLERALVGGWTALLDAAGRHSLGFLRSRESRHDASLLVFAAQRVAQARALAAPRLVADGVGLVGVLVSTVTLLGPRWLALGVLAAFALVPLALAATRRVRTAEREGYAALESFVADCRLVLDGALELRAHGLDASIHASGVARAARLAAERRRATAWRSVASMVPVALGLALVFAPAGLSLLPANAPLARLAIVGASALAFAASFLASLDDLAGAAPELAALERFLAAPGLTRAPSTPPKAPPGWLRRAPIVFEEVTVRHDGNASDTPRRFAHRWDAGRGLAVRGPNGSGKSSLVGALFGLVPLASGEFRLGEEAWSPELTAALREHVAFVPQRPFVAEARSIAWHLRLFAAESTDAQLEHALAEVGLLESLRSRGSGAPLDRLAGSLSGGELARMHLARILLPRGGRAPDLIVVDEPEAGLDGEGRARIRELLARLAETTPVLVVAHDESIVPESFARADCVCGV